MRIEQRILLRDMSSGIALLVGEKKGLNEASQLWCANESKVRV